MQRILQRKAHDPDCSIAVTGDINRPAYSESAGITALFERARICAEAGFVLEDTSLTGGVSDGNFPAALGIPTPDGAWRRRHGAHALDSSQVLLAGAASPALGKAHGNPAVEVRWGILTPPKQRSRFWVETTIDPAAQSAVGCAGILCSKQPRQQERDRSRASGAMPSALSPASDH